MNKAYLKLFEPGKIGRVSVRNRIVMLPLGGYFPTSTSEVGERSKAYYVERAKGGAGLIMVGASGIMPMDNPYSRRYFALSEDRLMASHYHLTEAVHIHGARIGIQLAHMGPQLNMSDMGGKPPLSPSGVVQLDASQKPFDKPRPMTRGEIYQMIEFFASAFLRAKRAGYDLVEIHAAHGYLLHAFLSGRTNLRKDEFGGSLENRARLVSEIIKEGHKLTGDDYPIGVRISAEEFLPNGITVKESVVIAKLLEDAGAAYINVGMGTGASQWQMNDVMRMEEGWKLPIWGTLKKAVTIPTIAGGGNKHADFCEKVISGGSADFVGLGRQLLADPYWPEKVMEGREEDIDYCISCLRCLYALGGGAQVVRQCTVNAMWGREVDYVDYRPSLLKKKVMVVGGGVAGLEAARVASMRGHRVTLYEKGKELGGIVLFGSIPPGKGKILWFRDYLVTQIKKQGVEIKLNKEVGPEEVEKEKPDVVFLATGSRQLIPDIPGIKGSNVILAWDILTGQAKLKGENIAVLGGGTVGCEVAEFLAKEGNKVTVIEMLSDIANDMEPINRQVLLNELEQSKVAVIKKKKVNEVTHNGVVVVDMESGEKQSLVFDKFILALGGTPVQDLMKPLEGKVKELYLVGDCVGYRPATILEAVREAFLIGHKI